MPKICYVPKNFSAGSLELIDQANWIIDEYLAAGYQLTLRQLYYQFVARDIIANRQTEYKRLGGIINDARMAGLIDWNAIEDRTRNVRELAHWDDVPDILESVSQQFRINLWERQSYRVEVWIEKDALVGVIDRVCRQFDVPYFACRGYSSQSEQWAAAQRFIRYIEDGQQPVILHLGDHDPSGIDMTRDNYDRLNLFVQHEVDGYVDVRRLALNYDQVEEYGPPPNPAKLTDSRARNYIANYGKDSWELDALDPPVINALIEDSIRNLIDPDEWEEDKDIIQTGREQLKKAADRWDEIGEMLDE